jgi:hypothetical protein
MAEDADESRTLLLDGDALELEFEGEIWSWRGPSPFHFVTVSGDAAVALHAVAADVSYGWGMIPVRVRIGDTHWDTSLFPKDGGYVLPLKDAVRAAEGLVDGDGVAVRLVIRR